MMSGRLIEILKSFNSQGLKTPRELEALLVAICTLEEVAKRNDLDQLLDSGLYAKASTALYEIERILKS